MAWEDQQPRALIRAANEAKRRERDANADPNSGDIKLMAAQRINEQWQRPPDPWREHVTTSARKTKRRKRGKRA